MHYIEKLFLGVLNLSETGALVILAVILLRSVLQKVPKKFSYVLWAIPAVRLLVPISFHGVLRLPEGSMGVHVKPEQMPAAEGASLSQNVGGQAVSGIAGHEPMQALETSGPSLLLVLAGLWLAGVAVFAAKNLFDYCRLRRELRICVECGEHIYLTDGITQPFVLAGFPCKIYVPSGLDEKERHYILLHEQVHVRRGDAFYKLLATAICCIYWFHPIVWLGVFLFIRDMEMSCDEAVFAGLDTAGKQAYALELLCYATGRKALLRFPCTFGEKGVRKRIMNLSRKKRTSRAALTLAGLVIVLAAVILIPNFQNMKDKKSKEAAADQADTGRDLPKEDGSDESDALPASEKEMPEKPVTDSVAPVQKADDDNGIREETIVLNGVPVHMRWQANECSREEMETLANLVYDEFCKIHEGECRLDGMNYDFETTGDLIQIFSKTENPMVWRLSVTLPDNWREDKGMGMMQQEESQQQEFDIALTKNAADEWKVAQRAWRVYYDDKGNFRWPDR